MLPRGDEEEEDHLALWVPYVSTIEAGTIAYGARRVLSALIYRRECDTIPRVSDTTGQCECEIGGISQ